ncbi:MAG: MMPL family transporter [Planctomycetaceae bacterium]|nr:MMPL family transporter [Planctomycetaceae bacterium]
MFTRLANFLTRHWVLVLVLWAAGAAAAILTAPSRQEVAGSGENAYLPAWVPSRQADEVIARHFERSSDVSSAVIIVERAGGLSGLGEAGQAQPAPPRSDWAFLSRLTAALQERASAMSWNVASPADPNLPLVQTLLVSPKKNAAVIVIGLPHNFLSGEAGAAVAKIESIMASAQPPGGLTVTITGSAGFGRDYTNAIELSLHRTTWVAAAAVVLILLILYRALPVVIVVMVVVALAVAVAVSIILIVARYGWSVSTMVELFAIIVGFGGGVDFSLFFLSRYHEELAHLSPSISRAERRALVARVMAGTGPAILASAATVAAALSLMYVATFPLFHTSGPSVAISVAVTCLASLTLTPVVAYLLGRGLFWPRRVDLDSVRTLAGAGLWDRVASFTVRRHVVILVATLAVLAPLSVGGWRQEVIYNTLADLPASDQSVLGWEIFKRHFPTGEMAPLQVVVELDKPLDEAAWAALAMTVDAQMAAMPQVRQVRSVAHPLGVGRLEIAPQLASVLMAQAAPATAPAATPPPAAGILPQLSTAIEQQARDLRESAHRYRSEVLPRYLARDRHAALWYVALPWQPYDNQAMDALPPLAQAVEEAVRTHPAAAGANPRVLIAGDTALMRDLRSVTDRDFLLVGIMAVVVIIVIVTLLIHDLLVALFVMLATVLTYGTALALTAWTFQFLADSHGLDWKINFFLFVILVAVGQDYNLFMLTRIMEERRNHPLRTAVHHAIARTGSTISFCGLVMAATLGSLSSSPLRLLQQLGMAFIVGILVDTFLVRPLMVPAFILAFNRMKNHALHKT